MADSLNGDYEQARKMLQRSAYETPIGRSPLSAYIYMRKSISFFRVCPAMHAPYPRALAPLR